MIKTYNETLGCWSLDTDDGHIIYRQGSDDYSVRRHLCNVKPEDLDLYVEMTLDEIPPFTKREYDAKVNELVRERYSESEEFAIQRKMLDAILSPAPLAIEEADEAAEPTTTTPADEFAAYNAYVEECKTAAKNPELYKRPEDEMPPVPVEA